MAAPLLKERRRRAIHFTRTNTRRRQNAINAKVFCGVLAPSRDTSASIATKTFTKVASAPLRRNVRRIRIKDFFVSDGVRGISNKGRVRYMSCTKPGGLGMTLLRRGKTGIFLRVWWFLYGHVFETRLRFLFPEMMRAKYFCFQGCW